MPEHSFELPAAPDGQIPVVHHWCAREPGRGAFILAHGMGEHSLRYASLAESLTAAGFDVYANDHRGHGKTVQDDSQLGDYGPDGWRGLIDDEIRLIRRVREEHAGPILILGHSMGSMVVQHLLTEVSDLLDGAALSGTTAVDAMAVAVAVAPTLRVDAPRELFRGRFQRGFMRTYDVAPDGRFLMVEVGDTPNPMHTSVRIVLNWFDELERLVLTEN